MNLTHSPADVLAQCLEDLGLVNVGSNRAWPVVIGREPNTPDNCVTIYNTLGTSDGRAMGDGEIQHHPGVQVRLRTNSEPTGWTKVNQIQTALAKSIRNTTVAIDTSEYKVVAVTGISDVIPLGSEQPTSKRVLFTINATMALTQTT